MSEFKDHKYVVVIPARMASTRLPRKPLIIINGKSMIQRTCEQVAKSIAKSKIIVATDNTEIFDHVTKLGFIAMMTSEYCLTGTDRVAEVAKKTNYDYYINVQGDEPLINPEDINTIIKKIEDYPNEILNGYTAIESSADYHSTSIPKVVFGPNKSLFYMSRAAIPGNKAASLLKAWRQICIYSFPKKALLEFASLGKKTPLEEIEDIEILRFIEMGYQVRMISLSNVSIAVDNPDDVEKVKIKLDEKR